MLTHEDILGKIKSKFGEDSLLKAYFSFNMLTVHIPRDKNIEILRYLKEDPEMNYIFLKDICGVHYPDNKGEEIGVVYLLHNLKDNLMLRVESFFPSEDSKIRSATSVWLTANWLERETYDFFGIEFEGHPDLRRILNMDDMDYFPMLKQYPLEDATREDKNDNMFGR
jgi:NADH-quinone oxidoreductase subunit C